MPELPPKRNLIELGMVAVLTSPMLLPPGFGLGSLEERKIFQWKPGNILEGRKYFNICYSGKMKVNQISPTAS